MKSESESHSVVSDCLQPQGLYSPWNSPGQNTGVDSLSLLQGFFTTQGSNLGLLHCRQVLYQQSHQGSPRTRVCSLSFSSRSSWPRNHPGSPALQVDSLPTEQSGKPTVRRSENQNTLSIWLIIVYVNAIKVWNSVSNTKSNWISRPREKSASVLKWICTIHTIALKLLNIQSFSHMWTHQEKVSHTRGPKWRNDPKEWVSSQKIIWGNRIPFFCFTALNIG